MDNPNPPPEVPPSFLIEKVLKLNLILESLNLKPQSSYSGVVCKNGRDSYVMLIELIKDDEYPCDDELNKDDDVGEEEFEGNHIDKFPTCSEKEQYDSLSNDEKENMKSVYLRNDEDKKKGVKYVMRKILGFYKGCLELGSEYQTGLEESSSGTSENHGGVTKLGKRKRNSAEEYEKKALKSRRV
ncbi:hypothetical protein Tco_1556295 [Tanacetum coccineum]